VVPEKDHPVRIDINGENFIDILMAKNISIGGVGIHVPYRFEGCEINKIVSLMVQLPEPYNYSFSVPGKIVHVTGNVFGGIFLDLKIPDKKLLKDFIKHNAQT